MNPADLQIAIPSDNNNGGGGGANGLASAAGLGVSGINGLVGGGKGAKLASSSVPRIDTEPMYTALKQCVGERWGEYKGALSGFLLGKLNQAELTAYLTPILINAALPPLPPLDLTSTKPHLFSTSPTALHLHNTLLAALYANAVYRDQPAEATASWVLATDEPSSSSSAAKGASGLGDKIDDRNKREVMALSARDRRRIKGVKEDAATASIDSGLAQADRYHRSLSALPSSALHNLGAGTTASSSSTTAAASSSAAAAAATSSSANNNGDAALSGKTNVDLEIRRRFALPLASETAEFPSRDNIAARIEPIAYEEGLASAASSSTAGAALAELLETGLEHYVKELVGSVFRSARTNGGSGNGGGSGDGGGATGGGAGTMVQAASWRARYRAEERGADAGDLARDPLGRLPLEIETVEKRAGLDVADLRLALRLDGGRCPDRFLGALLVEEDAANEAGTGAALEVDDEEEGRRKVEEKKVPVVVTNGVNGAGPLLSAVSAPDVRMTNGMDEDTGYGWAGASRSDRSALLDVLQGALAVG